jgi:hypothetical protein
MDGAHAVLKDVASASRKILLSNLFVKGYVVPLGFGAVNVVVRSLHKRAPRPNFAFRLEMYDEPAHRRMHSLSRMMCHPGA